MGLFIKKKDGNLSGIIGESSVGFDAIEKHFAKIYQENINPKHFFPLVAWRFGGNDPLDEIDVYCTKDFYHFVTYGLSELYDKESDNKEISGYGMEFTLKLKNTKEVDDDFLEDMASVIQDIARITFTEGELFSEGEYIDFGDTLFDTNISGFITVIDPIAKEINTENGKVKFILLIGVTKEELEAIKSGNLKVEELYKRNGELTVYKKNK